MYKVAFGGGCHWCTEAVFQQLKGVQQVEQGWVKSTPPNDTFSEAVVVHFDPNQIDLGSLVEIHLLTHASTSNHKLRYKYRSAVYVFDEAQAAQVDAILMKLQAENSKKYITKVLPFVSFKLNESTFLDYYKKNPEKPFCQVHISPKLQKLRAKFPTKMAE